MRTLLFIVLALTAFAQDATPITAEDIQAQIDNIDVGATVDQAIDSLGLGNLNDVTIAVVDDNGENGEFAEEWNIAINEEQDLNLDVNTAVIADALNSAAQQIQNDPQGTVDAVTDAVNNAGGSVSDTVANVANIAGVSQEDVNSIIDQNQAAIDSVTTTVQDAVNQATASGANTDQITQTVQDGLNSLGVDINTQG